MTYHRSVYMARNNQIGSLNKMVWHRILKEINIRSYTQKLGLYEAVSYINIGAVSVLKLSQALDITPCNGGGLQTSRSAHCRSFATQKQVPRRDEK